jgi:hypothetical protein
LESFCVEADGPARPNGARDRAKRRGLPGAVRAHERDDRALLDRKADAVQDIGLSIPGVHVVEFQQHEAAYTVPR